MPEENQGAEGTEGTEGAGTEGAEGSNQTGTEGGAQGAQQQAGAGTESNKGEEQKPPWGSDEEFDPERAWRLIQNLRQEKDELKPLADKAKELEDAQKSDVQRATEAQQTAEQKAVEASVEATRLRMAIKYGLEEEDLDLLGSGSEEDIENRAKRLAERITASSEGNEAPLPRRPNPRLRGGATPAGEVEETDPVKLAENLPRHY